MKWFKMDEFECKCGCEMPVGARCNMRALAEDVLDVVRERLGKPITVNSGYRCPKHNLKVGGAVNSQHMKGEAVDICCADNETLKRLIMENGKFDQLIVYPTFVHVSWKKDGWNRRQILRKAVTGYEKVEPSSI